MGATKELTSEHKNILQVIDALERECAALDSGKAVDSVFFAKAVDFIRSYADKFHHAKEEDILFAELSGPGVAMHCDPREQMLYEHDAGRKFVRGLEEAVAAGDKGRVVENAGGYAQLLRQHIYKEDRILYPMAEQALGEERGAKMAERFRAVDEKFAAANEKQLAFVREASERYTQKAA
ncbi:MAG: hemerythrin domain-containing protein [Elusimicrobiota bacterium]